MVNIHTICHYNNTYQINMAVSRQKVRLPRCACSLHGMALLHGMLMFAFCSVSFKAIMAKVMPYAFKMFQTNHHSTNAQ